MIRILLLPLGLIAAYFVFAAVKYTQMISNIFLSLVYKNPSEKPVSSLGEKVSILVSNDKEIGALFVEKKGSKKMLIFCHESGSSKESWEKYAYFVPDLGYHVLSLDFFSPDSDFEPASNALSQWPSEDSREKLRTVIHWAKRAIRADLEVVLFGVSHGANIAFAASLGEPCVKAVVADGLFSMKEIFRDYIRKWAPILVKPNLFGQRYPSWVVNIFTDLGFWYSEKKSGKKFIDVERLLQKPHAPLLMIHGGDDDYVSNIHQKYLERINQDVFALRHLVVAHAKHNEAVMLGRTLYEKTICEFLQNL